MYSFKYYTDSWIEISSQPSSSSLSSAATDEIVTTGLRVQRDATARRRRRLNPTTIAGMQTPARPASAAGSSQDEYEESESESDRVLSSSNEDISSRRGPSPLVASPSSLPSDDALSTDEDDNSTALGGTGNEPVFTPQPNAFSHPPASQSSRSANMVPESYFPATGLQANRTITQRHSYPNQRTRQHTPYNMISPSHQADHDAALRASLSTLLSCAAAARGLPKHDQPTSVNIGGNRVEPSTLRMVPESVVMGEEDIPPPLPRRISHNTTGSSSSASISTPATKGKRKASTSKDRRATKKSRRVGMEEIVSPTLMTWVISAGVVVLFSAISFSAGYALGREVGRTEAGVVAGGEGVGCGREAMKGGFRRLRWGAGSTASVRA